VRSATESTVESGGGTAPVGPGTSAPATDDLTPGYNPHWTSAL